MPVRVRPPAPTSMSLYFKGVEVFLMSAAIFSLLRSAHFSINFRPFCISAITRKDRSAQTIDSNIFLIAKQMGIDFCTLIISIPNALLQP